MEFVIGVLKAAAMVGAVGLLIGVFLGIAAIKFKVMVDEKEEAVLNLLPGNNCGGCGFAGCSGLAAAIAKGKAAVGACPVGGQPVADSIAAVMGVTAEAGVRQTAFVFCQGDCDKTTLDYEYTGIEDCRMLSFVPNGGAKTCNYGCLGFGSCVKVCPFDAIHIQNGIAVVDRESCKACGKCVEVCPKNLIQMIPYDAKCIAVCSSQDKGPITMKGCSVGCIGCSLCVKACPQGVVKIENLHAVIDPETCIGCGACAEKCPKKVIVMQKA